jgi:uncharacterized membrane protein
MAHRRRSDSIGNRSSLPVYIAGMLDPKTLMSFAIGGLVFCGFVIFLARALPESKSSEWRMMKQLEVLSPLLISLVWIGYGVLHLTSPGSALKQMPAALGPWRPELFAASGAAEIALGLLSISGAWRRLAFLLQLSMLVALAPFVIFLLTRDEAMTDLVGRMPLPVARLVLVFHNILLFLWIQWAYNRKPAPDLTSPRDWTRWTSALRSPVTLVAAVMLGANVAGFVVILGAPWQPVLGGLWGMACLACGALIGFVFGVPRWVGSRADRRDELYRPNANIEKLSDWLTKIVVGVGLVEFHQIGPTIGWLSGIFAAGAALKSGRTGTPEEAKALAAGIVVYFFVTGMIQGFLLTRMFLSRAWQTDAA